MDSMVIGSILRNLRGDKTQEQVACDLGITKSAYAMYEQGRRIPRDEVKIQIAKYYGTTVQDIFYPHVEH